MYLFVHTGVGLFLSGVIFEMTDKKDVYFSLINDRFYESNIYIKPPENLPIEVDLIGGDEVINFNNGENNEKLIFTTNATKGEKIRDFLRACIPIMSKRFLALFEGAGVDNLQVFPIIIKSEIDDTIWEDFFAVNVIGVIACANLEKSNYSEIMGGHYRFSELAIDSDKAQGALLFRLAEHTPTIMMHKDVGRYIMEQDPNETLQGWNVDRPIQ